MNYLSHYYFDLKDERSEYLMGIALPDLMGSFNRRYKCHEIPEFKTAEPAVPEDLWVLQEGINRHHRLDALFHNGTFFDSQTKWLGKELKELGFNSIHKYFFFYAHVLLEILLDRILLEEVPEIADRFYNQLDAVSEELIYSYFEFNKLILHPEDFADHFQEFMKHRFLFMYAKPDSVARAMGRIHFRLREDHLSEHDLNLLSSKVGEYTKRIRSSYKDFAEVLK